MLLLRRSTWHFVNLLIDCVSFCCCFFSCLWWLLINEDWLYRYSSNLASNNKRVDLFDGPAEEHMEENVLLASSKLLLNLLATSQQWDVYCTFLDLVLCYMNIHLIEFLIIPDMSNQELMDKGNSMMDDTDQAIERGKKVSTFLFRLHIIWISSPPEISAYYTWSCAIW